MTKNTTQSLKRITLSACQLVEAIGIIKHFRKYFESFVSFCHLMKPKYGILFPVTPFKLNVF